MSYARSSIPAQRHRLIHELRTHDLPAQTTYDAALVLDELVTNALEHGEPLEDGGIHLCWGAWDGLVHVEVTDRGTGMVSEALAAPTAATRGRGLVIVAALATSWGVRTAAAAKTVWAALPAGRSAA